MIGTDRSIFKLRTLLRPRRTIFELAVILVENKFVQCLSVSQVSSKKDVDKSACVMCVGHIIVDIREFIACCSRCYRSKLFYNPRPNKHGGVTIYK